MTFLLFVSWMTIVARATIGIIGIRFSRRMLIIYQQDKRDLANVNGIVQRTIDSRIFVGTKILQLFYSLTVLIMFSAVRLWFRPTTRWWELIGPLIVLWFMWQILQMKQMHALTYKETLAHALTAVGMVTQDHIAERKEDANGRAIVAETLKLQIERGIDAAHDAAKEANSVNKKIDTVNKEIEMLNKEIRDLRLDFNALIERLTVKG